MACHSSHVKVRVKVYLNIPTDEQKGSRGVDRMGVQIHAPTALSSGKRLGTYFKAGWVDPRADLQEYGEEKILWP
jgi:hypothetical protein